MYQKAGSCLSWLVPTVLAIVGIGTVVALAIAVHRRSVFMEESSSFVDHAVPAIFATWDADQLLKRVTPAYKSRITERDLKGLADVGFQLGPFEEFLGATNLTSLSYLAGFGAAPPMTYVAKTRYLEGLATIHVSVVERHGRWMIDKYGVDVFRLGLPGPEIERKLLLGSGG